MAKSAVPDGTLLDPYRSSYICILGGSECHPFIFSVRNVATYVEPESFPLTYHVRRSIAAAARLLARRSRLRNSESECPGRRTPSSAARFSGDTSDHVYGGVCSTRGGPEPGVGISAQPFV